MLPHLLTVAGKKAADGTEIVILVATSGDTGKAALEGFKDVKNTRILVFTPRTASAQCRSFRCALRRAATSPSAPLRAILTTLRAE